MTYTLYRVDFVSEGKKHNYAVNLPLQTASLMLESVLSNDGYVDGKYVTSATVERQYGFLTTRDVIKADASNDNEWQALARAGRRIDAIKVYRVAGGRAPKYWDKVCQRYIEGSYVIGLKEAKDHVMAWLETI